MIVALLLVWIAFTAFAVSGLAWLEPRSRPPREPGSPPALPRPDEPRPLAMALDEAEARGARTLAGLG
ncbi:MAG: hypothetical protein ACQGVK_08325 [Myxococcota bacterium]